MSEGETSRSIEPCAMSLACRVELVEEGVVDHSARSSAVSFGRGNETPSRAHPMTGMRLYVKPMEQAT